MFKVYVNPGKARVLVTKAQVEEGEWVLVSAHPTWERAYRKALFIADLYDYVLEWDAGEAPRRGLSRGVERAWAHSFTPSAEAWGQRRRINMRRITPGLWQLAWTK
ncbi:MAG: hypothetical protein QXI84_08295 [Thermofilaceae archaeon]